MKSIPTRSPAHERLSLLHPSEFPRLRKPTPIKPLRCRPVPWWERLFNFWSHK